MLVVWTTIVLTMIFVCVCVCVLTVIDKHDERTATSKLFIDVIWRIHTWHAYW